MARSMAASLPSGGGGTLASHAMLTKTLRPDGMVTGAGESLEATVAEFWVVYLTQKPGEGARSTCVVAEAMGRTSA